MELYQREGEEATVIDLHNDLLSYLALSPSHMPDEASCCSARQLREGGIRCQVLPAFFQTIAGSEKTLERQLACFRRLFEEYPDDFSTSLQPGRIHIRWAIENVSTFLGEEEPLENGINRLQAACQEFGPPVYVSLTWNGENRCGGGAGADKGLTEDGRAILEALDRRVALDLSHASDRLAYDMAEHSSRLLIASHSNFRSVMNASRNLPDDLAQEIVKRDGVIGLNVIKPFIGNSKDSFFDHIDYALSHGWEGALSFGADFYSMESVPEDLKEELVGHFFTEWKDPSSARHIAAEVVSRFGTDIARKLFWSNAWEKLLKRS